MGEGGFLGLAIAPWAPVIAAYVFGIATGWLIWGGARNAPRSNADAEPADGAAAPAETVDDAADLKAQIASGTTDADPCPASMKLGALESEIRTARELLTERDEETEAFVEELSALDAAIKRANGRLKLVLRAVKRAARGR